MHACWVSAVTPAKALSAARVLVNLPGQFTNLATSASWSTRQVKVVTSAATPLAAGNGRGLAMRCLRYWYAQFGRHQLAGPPGHYLPPPAIADRLDQHQPPATLILWTGLFRPW